MSTNTVAVRFIDEGGNNKEVWTTDTTTLNAWKQMCLPLNQFSDTVNLAAISRVQITPHWAGVYYLDHLQLI